MYPRFVFAIAVVTLWASAMVQGAESGLPAPLGLRVLDTEGGIHQIGDSEACPGVVLIFTSPECPVANRYVAELNRIFQEARAQGWEFYGVVADPALSREAIAKHCLEFQIEFPVIPDTAGVLARICQPTHVPQAFVYNRQGELVYHGRIDDQFAAVGRRRDQVTERNLLDAITAVNEGRLPAVTSTETVGCRLQPFEVPEQVTYARHIAPILYANCVGCHRPGEVAPFPLLSYLDAAKRADFLADVTSTRVMPPWHARPGYGHFRGDRRLNDQEIQLITTWAQAQAPEGDAADLPPLPQFTDGWQLGEPDLVLTMREEYVVAADGPDIFRYFVIPIGIPEDKVVSAVEFRPGNPRVVHHAILYLDTSGIAMQRDEADPEPGYEGFLNGGFPPAGMLGFWAPGYTPRFLPQGVGQRLAKEADLALQLHYHPSGREEVDRSEVGIYFSDKPVDSFVSTFAMIDLRVDIPAGEARHKMQYSFQTPVDLEVLDVTPHMHMIGTEMKVIATLPEGEQVPLVWSDWNFNWQEQYLYRDPVKLPAGTKIDLEAWFDNSAENPYNPNQPPARVQLGEMTTDEMCICAFQMIHNHSDEDRALLQKATRESMRQQFSDPKVMLQLMQLMGREGADGNRPGLRDMFGPGNRRDRD